MAWISRIATGIGMAALILGGLACGETDSTPSVAGTESPEVSAVTVGDLGSNPGRYEGKEVLVTGYYFHGWETIVLSEKLELSGFAEGHLWPTGHKIWVEGSVPAEIYEKLPTQDMMGPTERYGKLRINGRFEHGGQYGHGGSHTSQIVPLDIEMLGWSPSEVGP